MSFIVMTRSNEVCRPLRDGIYKNNGYRLEFVYAWDLWNYVTWIWFENLAANCVCSLGYSAAHILKLMAWFFNTYTVHLFCP